MFFKAFKMHFFLPFGCRFPTSAVTFGPDNLSCTLFGLPVMDSSNTSSSPCWLISSRAGLLLSVSSAVSSSCLIVSSVKDKQQFWDAYLYSVTFRYRFYERDLTVPNNLTTNYMFQVCCGTHNSNKNKKKVTQTSLIYLFKEQAHWSNAWWADVETSYLIWGSSAHEITK